MGKRKRMGMTLLLGSSMLVAGPVLAGCTTGVTADDWAATEGAIGRINMEEVEEAFKESQTVEQFEKRLNEIYEGDGIVLIRAKDEDGKRIIEGYEDLNNDDDITPEQDDLLFTITNEGDSNDLRGNGANQHYRSSFGGGNFLFTYLIFSSLGRGGFGYYTPRSRVPQVESQRNSYRNSPGYAGGPDGGQVKRNSNYYNKQRAANRSSYNSAGRQLSPARQSYIGTQKASGTFRSSNTGVRSGFGKFGRSAGREGASGGGGAQVIVRRGGW
jgi:hypothetical protein